LEINYNPFKPISHDKDVNITEDEYFRIVGEYGNFIPGDSHMHHAARLGHL
jgi:hypothetical protein